MFYLRDILRFIVDRFNQGSLPQQNLIGYAHQRVLHIVLYLGDKLYAIKKEVLKQGADF